MHLKSPQKSELFPYAALHVKRLTYLISTKMPPIALTLLVPIDEAIIARIPLVAASVPILVVIAHAGCRVLHHCVFIRVPVALNVVAVCVFLSGNMSKGDSCQDQDVSGLYLSLMQMPN